MKLFLIILLAGVWSTAVTAAPSSLAPNNTFQIEEYGLDSIEDLTTLFKVDTVGCFKNVVAQVVAGSEFNSIWDETKNKIDHLIYVEWSKCQSFGSIVDKFKCHLDVVKHLEDVAMEFAKELHIASAWKLMNEINEKILSQCFHQTIDRFEIEEFKAPTPGARFLARSECVAKVLANVSKTLGLQSIWEKSQPQLVHHLDKWKQCTNIKNAVFRYICQVKESASTFVIISEYMKLAATQNPEFKESFCAEYKKSCAGKSSVNELTEISAVEIEEFQVPSSGAVLARFECVAEVLGKVSKVHGLESFWEKYQSQLSYHLGKWKQCAKVTNSIFRQICETKEGAATFGIVIEYVKLAVVKEPKFALSFAAEYKKTCAGESYVDELFEIFAVEGVEAIVQKLVEKLKCISEAISEAVQGANFQHPWEEAKHDLEQLLNELNACTNLSTTSEAAKCIIKQLNGSYSVVFKFLSNLKETSHDVFNKVKANIRKKCYA